MICTFHEIQPYSPLPLGVTHPTTTSPVVILHGVARLHKSAIVAEFTHRHPRVAESLHSHDTKTGSASRLCGGVDYSSNLGGFLLQCFL